MDSWIRQTQRRLRVVSPRNLGADSTLDELVRSLPEDDPSENELPTAFAFLLVLGRALLSLGLPAQRLEMALQHLGERLGVELECFSTPTALMLSVTDAEPPRTQLVRVEPGDVDLERLSALHALVGRVERGELGPAEATRRLAAILSRPTRYSAAIRLLAHALVSLGSVVLLGGGPHDLAPAFALGGLVGLLQRAGERAPTFGRLLPAAAALLASVLIRALAWSALPVHELPLLLSALLLLLPGYTLTVATMELATANVVSGTSRLVGAFSTLLQLGFGVALGHRLLTLLPGVATASASAAEPWMVWLAPVLVIAGLAVLLRAAPRDWPAIFAACVVATLGARLGRAALGAEIGAFVGAVSLGCVSHLFARRFDRPAQLLLTPGILLLVPGSVGFLSVASMLESDTMLALETAFRMILIATSLAAGVLVATAALPPRRAL